MTAIWSKSYLDLDETVRKTFYSATVSEHHWPGHFVFRAHPSRGDWCVECISEDRDALIRSAERWLAGEQPEGFYSASF